MTHPPLKLFLLRAGEHFWHPPTCPVTPHLFYRAVVEAQQLATPSAELRLVDTWQAADFVVFPYPLDHIYDNHLLLGLNRFIRTIPDFAQFARKTVFWFSNDLPIDLDFPSVFLRYSADRRSESSTITVPYHVEDLGCETHFDPQQIRYHTAFVGFTGSAPVRAALLKGFYETSHRLKCLIDVHQEFHGHKSPEAQRAGRKRFLDSVRNSFTVLCPRGTGLNSFRFFESMSMGRVPILLSDHCVLPFEDQVSYADAILSIPESMAGASAALLEKWLDERTPAQVIEQGQRCRSLWLNFLSPKTVFKSVLTSLARWRERHGSSLDESADLQVVADEDALLHQLNAQLQYFLGAEDDVNALVMLQNIRAILQTHGRPDGEIEKAIAELKQVIAAKNSLLTAYFEKFRQIAPPPA